LTIREIYSAHNVYYRFSVLAMNIETQPDRLLQWSIFKSGHQRFSSTTHTQRRSVYPTVVTCCHRINRTHILCAWVVEENRCGARARKSSLVTCKQTRVVSQRLLFMVWLTSRK